MFDPLVHLLTYFFCVYVPIRLTEYGCSVSVLVIATACLITAFCELLRSNLDIFRVSVRYISHG